MRALTTLLMAACLLSVAAAPATASVNISLNPTIGDTVVFPSADYVYGQPFYYNNNGVTYYGGPVLGKLNTGATWTTFCVEADGGDESIALDHPYKVSSLDPHVAINTNNYVTDQAKWLYWEYGNGMLPDKLASGEKWTGTDLQVAIWHGVWAHGDVATPLDMFTDPACTLSAYDNDQAAQDLYNLASNAFILSEGITRDPLAQIKADSIWVLNPADGNTQAQSMLYEVPEPATMIVWTLLGIAGWLATMVWRRRAA